jgi:glycosyltransferase involved in cell wall biosynthesis
MAVFNGERYLAEQVLSILPQLQDDDEIVIVDDASIDGSVAILEGMNDRRIHIIRQTHNLGVLKTYERALTEARGDVIFLCDQDDVWREDKVEKILGVLSYYHDVSLVISDGMIIDADGNITERSCLVSGKFYGSILSNLVRNRYLGCTMAFRRHLLRYCLPFPDDTPMHDMWIGMVNQLVGKVGYINEPLISYRRHGNNTTTGTHASLGRMLRWRYALVKNLTWLYVNNVILESHDISNRIKRL